MFYRLIICSVSIVCVEVVCHVGVYPSSSVGRKGTSGGNIEVEWLEYLGSENMKHRITYLDENNACIHIYVYI